MQHPAPHSCADDAWFAAGLARASAALDSTAPILRHLVRGEERELFGDALIAQVRGMVDDVARQLAVAQAQAGGADAGVEPDGDEVAGFSALLCANGAFLAAVHGQALEWQLARRLEQDHGVDMIVPPLLEAVMANPDGAGSEHGSAALAMAVLVAQARFCQAQRRMALPLEELPQDLLRIALGTLHARAQDDAEAQSRAIIAERSLRLRFDAERGRLALLRRLVDGLPAAAPALDPLHAGPALFLTALARAMGAPREDAALLVAPSHLTRLALVLRAAGVDGDAVRAHVAVFHPEALVPQGIAALSPDAAAARLAQAGLGG
jgi:hypothetical protein